MPVEAVYIFITVILFNLRKLIQGCRALSFFLTTKKQEPRVEEDDACS